MLRIFPYSAAGATHRSDLGHTCAWQSHRSRGRHVTKAMVDYCSSADLPSRAATDFLTRGRLFHLVICPAATSEWIPTVHFSLLESLFHVLKETSVALDISQALARESDIFFDRLCVQTRSWYCPGTRFLSPLSEMRHNERCGLRLDRVNERTDRSFLKDASTDSSGLGR